MTARLLRLGLFFMAGLSLMACSILVVRAVGYEPLIYLGASRDWFEYDTFDHIHRNAAQLFAIADLAVLSLLVIGPVVVLGRFRVDLSWADVIAAINPVSLGLAYVLVRNVIGDDQVTFIDLGNGSLLGVLFGWLLLCMWAKLVWAKRHSPRP